MRQKILLLLLMAIHIVPAVAQNHCQEPTNTQQFASMGTSPGFAGQHPEPADYRHEDALGEMVTLNIENGENAQAYLIKAEGGSDKYLFVFHEWWGLNDHIKRQAEKIYQDLEDINVLALDLYDGKVASTREKAQQFMQATTDERGKAIIDAAMKYAGQNASIGTIGWCFGGGWSLQAAIMLQESARACVMYYGMPVMDVNQLKQLETPVLGIFAQKDGWINPQKVAEFEKAMQEAGQVAMVYMFDANHAFANPSQEAYAPAAADEAYTITIDYLKERFK